MPQARESVGFSLSGTVEVKNVDFTAADVGTRSERRWSDYLRADDVSVLRLDYNSVLAVLAHRFSSVVTLLRNDHGM
jgi:hypothetical protein